MIPGISTNAEARLTGVLDPRVTDTAEDSFAARDYTILDASDEEARRLGVQCSGGGVTLVVTDPTRRLGDIRVQSGGRDNTLFFDNLAWGGNCHASIRMLGHDAMLLAAERIGMGAIVGTRALVKGTVPPRVVVAGMPARVIREGVSWGRSNNGMTAAERLAIGLPEQPES